MKPLLKTIALFAITSFFFISCKDDDSTEATETKPAFDLGAVKKAIEETSVAFMDFVKKGDSTGLAGLYASDAKLMGANMPAVSGKKEIESAFGQMLAAGIGSASLTTVEVWGNEALVAEEGTYTLMDKAGKEIDKGKYIVLWKMEDGKWKLFRDCFNSDLPPAPMPAK